MSTGRSTADRLLPVAVGMRARVSCFDQPAYVATASITETVAAVGTTIAVSLTKKIIERTWNQTVQPSRGR